MRKILLLACALLISFMSNAQLKGDKYFAGGISLSAGSQIIKAQDKSYITNHTQPSDFSFAIGGEFGCFVDNNFRIAIGLSIPVSIKPTSEDDSGKWLKTKTIGLALNPSLSYYFPITDRFFYTPELGFSYEFGSYNEMLTSNENYKTRYTGWTVYANYAAFEFKINEKFAIGLNLGSFNYAYANVKVKDSDAHIATSVFKFDINSGNACFRVYL